jgi:glucose-6-phosphate isomerase
MTITVEQIDARAVGTLIALYERAVGLYASLVNINAYHQPGVEAGKKAATAVLNLQGEIMACIGNEAGKELTAEEVAAAIGRPEESETVFHILLHAATNPDHGVTMTKAEDIWKSRFTAKG